MFAGRRSFIRGANADEEVVSGSSTALWRVFIRRCNLRLLQGWRGGWGGGLGVGQRWLLYFMARKITGPHKVHLVHMEVGRAFAARAAAVSKHCEKGGRPNVLPFCSKAVKLEL